MCGSTRPTGTWGYPPGGDNPAASRAAPSLDPALAKNLVCNRDDSQLKRVCHLPLLSIPQHPSDGAQEMKNMGDVVSLSLNSDLLRDIFLHAKPYGHHESPDNLNLGCWVSILRHGQGFEAQTYPRHRLRLWVQRRLSCPGNEGQRRGSPDIRGSLLFAPQG